MGVPVPYCVSVCIFYCVKNVTKLNVGKHGRHFSASKSIWIRIILCCFLFLISFQWVYDDLATFISKCVCARLRGACVCACVLSQEKSLETLDHGWELNPGDGEGRRWDTFILPLASHDWRLPPLYDGFAHALKLIWLRCNIYIYIFLSWYSVRSHIVHLSAASALPMIREAQQNGVPITIETCHHYLTLTSEKVPDSATEYKCCPPIRDSKNQVSSASFCCNKSDIIH